MDNILQAGKPNGLLACFGLAKYGIVSLIRNHTNFRRYLVAFLAASSFVVRWLLCPRFMLCVLYRLLQPVRDLCDAGGHFDVVSCARV